MFSLIQDIWRATGHYPRAASLVLMHGDNATHNEPITYEPHDSWKSYAQRPTDKLPDDVIDIFPLLSNDVSKPIMDYLVNTRRIEPDVIELIGVRCWVDENLILFPYTNNLGEITLLKARSYKEKKMFNITPEYVGQPWLRFRSAQATGSWLGLHLINWQEPVYIVEGECFPLDASVLTPNGWICFEDYNGENVLQVFDDFTASFVKPTAIIKKDFDGELITYETKGYLSKTTPGHLLVTLDTEGNLCKTEAQNYPKQGHHVPRVVQVDGPGINLTDNEIRLCVAVSADFTIDYRKGTGSCKPREMRYARGGFKKERKVQRILWLLETLGLHYSCTKPSKKKYIYISFSMPDWVVGREFPHEWLSLATLHQRNLILGEMVYWDGNSVKHRDQTEYTSMSYKNIVFMQTLAHTCGKISTVMHRRNQYGSWYKISILHGKSTNSTQCLRKSSDYYKGKVFCVSVPSGMLLVKQNDKITVTGNCDMMRLLSLGRSNTIAAGTSGISQAQLDALHGINYRLGFDADDSGRAGAAKVYRMLSNKNIVSVLDWSVAGCKDPGDITSEEQIVNVMEHLRLSL
jgi:hypothetical protein